MRKFWQQSLLATALAVTAPASALAHPHEFVTMLTTAVFNKQGEVKSFRYVWTFDEFFTAYAVEGQDANKNGKAEQSELDALLQEILGNIKPINYFTKFDTNHPAPKLGNATPISASMNGRQMVMSFEVALAKPYSLAKNPLNYAVYDDEFYIAMQHEDGDKSASLSNAPKNCSSEILAADPSEDVQNFASSLGKNESGGSDLGASFAEWVTISCKGKSS